MKKEVEGVVEDLPELDLQDIEEGAKEVFDVVKKCEVIVVVH